MWGDALSELQNLTEKGNLQGRHTLQPGLQTSRAKGAPHLTAIGHRGLDNSINQAPHHRKGLVAMKALKLGNKVNKGRFGPIPILQKPVKSMAHVP